MQAMVGVDKELRRGQHEAFLEVREQEESPKNDLDIANEYLWVLILARNCVFFWKLVAINLVVTTIFFSALCLFGYKNSFQTCAIWTV